MILTNGMIPLMPPIHATHQKHILEFFFLFSFHFSIKKYRNNYIFLMFKTVSYTKVLNKISFFFFFLSYNHNGGHLTSSLQLLMPTICAYVASPCLHVGERNKVRWAREMLTLLLTHMFIPYEHHNSREKIVFLDLIVTIT